MAGELIPIPALKLSLLPRDRKRSGAPAALSFLVVTSVRGNLALGSLQPSVSDRNYTRTLSRVRWFMESDSATILLLVPSKQIAASPRFFPMTMLSGERE